MKHTLRNMVYTIVLSILLSVNVCHAVDALDATKPGNKDAVSTLPTYERETRAKVNEVIAAIPDISSYTLVTGAASPVSGDKLIVDTAAAPATITLPASPATGAFVYLVDAKNTWATNNVTIARNGSMIEGVASNYTINTGFGYILTYTGVSYGWAIRNNGIILPISPSIVDKSVPWTFTAALSAPTLSLTYPEIYPISNYSDSLATAVSTIGVTNRTVLINKVITVSGNLTVPSNIELLFTREGRISVNTGITLAIQGNIAAGPFQIFAGLGTVTTTQTPLAAYAEWFGIDGVDDSIAMQKCLTAFGRLDLVPGTVYVSRTQLTLTQNQTIDGHRAEWRGHSNLAGLQLMKALATGPAGDIPTTPIKWITIKDINFDYYGAGGFFYLLGGYNVTIEKVAILNTQSTANTVAYHFRNSFDFVLNDCQINGALATNSTGVKLTSNSDYTGYEVINNFAFRDCIFQRLSYGLYLDINEDNKGTAGNTALIENCSFLGSTVGGLHNGTAIEFASGSFRKINIVATKSEFWSKFLHVANAVGAYSINISGLNTINAASVFDLDTCEAGLADCTNGPVGTINISDFYYGTTAECPAGDYYVFQNVDSEVYFLGSLQESVDSVSGYATNGLWPGKASLGNGFIRRTPAYRITKTGNFTISPGHDHYEYNNEGAAGTVTATLPALSTVPYGFTVSFRQEAAGKDFTVLSAGTDWIRYLTLIAGDDLTSSKGGAYLELVATALGWLPSSGSVGFKDVAGKRTYTGTTTKTGPGTLFTIPIPANTLGKQSTMRINIFGLKTGSTSRDIDVALGSSSTLHLVDDSITSAAWSCTLYIKSNGLTSQHVDAACMDGAITQNLGVIWAQDLSTDLNLVFAVTGGGADDVLVTGVEVEQL